MRDNEDYIELVEKAGCGDKESLNRLAEIARVRLREYVLRLTLDEDLAEDIVQESILEMFKVFEKLKMAERFWPWLYGIAFNKVRGHYGQQWRHKRVSLSAAAGGIAEKDSNDALADVISQELKEIVLRSMQELEPRHRAVLTMRCYDQMAYSEIAKLMGCTELGVRALFYRAKKSLAKKLSGHGFGKGSLLVALALFGKITATSEAAAANISVTAATVKVGVAAALAATATSKTTIVSIAAVGTIAAGTVAIEYGRDKASAVPHNSKPESLYNAPPEARTIKSIGEHWYYYPPSADGVVMMKLKSNEDGRQSYCQWLQNDQANYYRRGNSIYINNHRMWAEDLRVRRLPTDSPQLREFLSQLEGSVDSMKYVPNNGAGLLVVVKHSEDGDSSQTAHRYDVSDEEYFRYSWPAGAKTIDNRDAMHKRGWTYFRITGEISGAAVSGVGRMPFVYAASKRFSPWLKLELRDGSRIVDNGAGACVYDRSGKVAARYKGGSFFKGLARPWMGLHTVDVVRRDAAEQHVRFETKLASGGDKAEVVLTLEEGQMVYSIDMETDVVEKITFSASDGSEAELRFSYLQNIDSVGNEFTQPRIGSYRSLQQNQPGMLWLVKLAKNRW